MSGTKNIFKILFAAILCISATVYNGCKRNQPVADPYGDHIDTLRVVTLYGPTSFFDYRGEYMGIDYENARKFAEDEGMVMEIKALDNITELISSLQSGEAHLAAYPVPLIAEYKENVQHVGHTEITRQVLVQKEGPDRIKDVTELVGKEIAVLKDTKYFYRLENLNNELGGGIKIIPIENDTVDSEDLLGMVSRGDIEFTVVDSEIANLYKKSFPGIDISLPISANQRASWAVAPGLDSLAAKINRWENRSQSTEFIKEIYKRYYDRTLDEAFDVNLSYFKKRENLKDGRASQYDEIFKRHAKTAGYDWQLLAAIAYCESRFIVDVTSSFGATGLMQVMPLSAKAVGVDPASLLNPDYNVQAAARILAKLEKAFESSVSDPEERMKFVVAAYNSGLGHIYDAMAIADKIGLDHQKWNGNVSVTALMKSRPEYYNDPVVKHGYFRGRETVDFVDHVTSIYSYLKGNSK